MTTMILSPSDMLQATHLAGLINGIKTVQVAERSARNKRITNMGDFQIHLIGKVGEFAVARYLGIEVRDDLTVGGDGAIDLVKLGQSIQVKTRADAKEQARNGELLLIFNHIGEFQADWSVLCSVDRVCSVTLHGFVSRERFAANARSKDFGYGARLVIAASQLSSMEHFDKAVAHRAMRQQVCESEGATV